MAILVTYAEGHPKHKEVIDWTQDPWPNPATYTTERFAIVFFDCPENMKPKQTEAGLYLPVSNLEPIDPQKFETYDGTIVCPRCYHCDSIEIEPLNLEYV